MRAGREPGGCSSPAGLSTAQLHPSMLDCLKASPLLSCRHPHLGRMLSPGAPSSGIRGRSTPQQALPLAGPHVALQPQGVPGRVPVLADGPATLPRPRCGWRQSPHGTEAGVAPAASAGAVTAAPVSRWRRGRCCPSPVRARCLPGPALGQLLCQVQQSLSC